jgi:hypothetical protein
MREFATAGLVAPHVFDDLRLINRAVARGELRGCRYAKVVGPPEARRVVPADDDPASAPRLSAARCRLATMERDLRAPAEADRKLARARKPAPSMLHAAVETYHRRPITYRELGEMNDAAYRRANAFPPRRAR